MVNVLWLIPATAAGAIISAVISVLPEIIQPWRQARKLRKAAKHEGLQ